jgi:hypothetical protein
MRSADAEPADPSSPLRWLAAKGAAQQWTVAEVMDRDQAVTLPRWLLGKFYTAVISQSYHGEMATLAMCRRLVDGLDDPWARRCMEIQITDETRHAEAYWTCLAGIGELAAAYEKALSRTDSPETLIAAFNIVLEGEALFALDYLGSWFRCPRFLGLNARIARDEARYLAFGRLYLGARSLRMAREQRIDIHRWLKDLWTESAFGILDRFPAPSAVLGRRCRTWVETGWQDHRRALISIGLVSVEEARLAEEGL